MCSEWELTAEVYTSNLRFLIFLIVWDLHFKTNYDLLSFKIFTLFQSKVDSSKYSRSLNKPGLGAYTILKNLSITLRLAVAVRGATDAAN